MKFRLFWRGDVPSGQYTVSEPNIVPPPEGLEVVTVDELVLDKADVDHIIERCLQRARPPMKKWLGERTRGYDAADEIAEGIARGIRQGLAEKGLTKDEESP